MYTFLFINRFLAQSLPKCWPQLRRLTHCGQRSKTHFKFDGHLQRVHDGTHVYRADLPAPNQTISESFLRKHVRRSHSLLAGFAKPLLTTTTTQLVSFVLRCARSNQTTAVARKIELEPPKEDKKKAPQIIFQASFGHHLPFRRHHFGPVSICSRTCMCVFVRVFLFLVSLPPKSSNIHTVLRPNCVLRVVALVRGWKRACGVDEASEAINLRQYCGRTWVAWDERER